MGAHGVTGGGGAVSQSVSQSVSYPVSHSIIGFFLSKCIHIPKYYIISGGSRHSIRRKGGGGWGMQ